MVLRCRTMSAKVPSDGLLQLVLTPSDMGDRFGQVQSLMRPGRRVLQGRECHSSASRLACSLCAGWGESLGRYEIKARQETREPHFRWVVSQMMGHGGRATLEASNETGMV